jgi:predicted GIY-YIG superfamily endonuclease
VTGMPEPTHNDGTQMYRLYNADGTLLYVGISWSALSRITQHKTDKPWWTTVTRVDITTIPGDRAAAESAERHAIHTEQPLHNVVHNRTRTERPAVIVPNTTPNSIIGYGILTDDHGGLQGQITAIIADQYVAIDTFSWLTGTYYETRILPLDQITTWHLYSDLDRFQEAAQTKIRENLNRP